MDLSEVTALAMSASALVTGCGNGATECDCAAPGAHVHVPPESAAAVTAVRLSGAACEGTSPACTQSTPTGCATYALNAHAAGTCGVDVIFVDATFHADITFARGGACCTGLYPTPAGAGAIDAVRAPSDAGATE
jgi:hypothetical protein